MLADGWRSVSACRFLMRFLFGGNGYAHTLVKWGRSFFSRLLAKITLTPFNGPRSKCGGVPGVYGHRCVIRLLLRGCLPGVARQLVTFLASPRKVTKRRRSHSRCPPLAGSQMSRAPVGWDTNSLRSNMCPIIPDCHLSHLATSACEKSKATSTSKPTSKPTPRS